MTWSLRRNTDQSLPASHTVEVMFKLPADFSSGSIYNVPGILMKQTEQTRGVPLAGLAVKVTNGFFLIGLSAVDDRPRAQYPVAQGARPGSTSRWSTPTTAAPSSRSKKAPRRARLHGCVQGVGAVAALARHLARQCRTDAQVKGTHHEACGGMPWPG